MPGRSPKIGGSKDNFIAVHAVNNYVYDNTGYAFDVSQRGYVLVEGNYFDSVKTPSQPDPKGNIFVPAAAGASIGRDCEVNVLTDSGTFASNSEGAATQQLGTFKTQIVGTKVATAAQVSAATGNFGVGELGSDKVTQQTTTTGCSDAQETEAPTATQATQEMIERGRLPRWEDAPQATNARVGTTAAASTDMPLGTVTPYADDSGIWKLGSARAKQRLDQLV